MKNALDCYPIPILPGQPRNEMAKFCANYEHYMLIGAMNPCPCGYFGDPVKACTIANRAGSETIQPAHLIEALQYRPRMMEE